MKITLSFLTLLFLSNIVLAQTTAIPDANFEQALINLGLDVGVPDGTIPTANIDTLTVLDVQNLSISDLTGIEDFIGLTDLLCHKNTITSLDFSNNIALVRLVCYENQLTNLDVTNNTALSFLNCNDNQLTSLDLTNNTVIWGLHCRNNQLTNLDVTNNTILTFLNCFNNQLNCLNVKNGNNHNMNNSIDFEARNNPNLTCINVDDVTYSTTNWTQIDVQTSFDTNCNNDCSPVGLEENILSQLSIYPNPTLGSINIDLEETKSNINLRLINALGQVVLTKNYKSTNHINFDIDAPKGLYFLQLETSDGETQTLKVIKE